jgi:hypothetical protein
MILSEETTRKKTIGNIVVLQRRMTSLRNFPKKGFRVKPSLRFMEKKKTST